MKPPLDTVAIVGVGLLGSSLGLALRQRALARRILGVGRNPATLDRALARGAIDDCVSLDEAAAADMIVIATPAGSVCATLDALREKMRPDAVVTDVASTKAVICAHARKTWPSPRRFVGSHPMAGSERSGPEHGDASLYDGAVCLVEEAADLAPDACAAVTHLWEAVGARVVPVAPEQHDALLACTSHLPHAAAAALARLAAKVGANANHVGNGFRDVTRIAASRPEVWRDICLTNREALLEAMKEFEISLVAFRRALESRDGTTLEAFFQSGRDARAKVLGT